MCIQIIMNIELYGILTHSCEHSRVLKVLYLVTSCVSISWFIFVLLHLKPTANLSDLIYIYIN